MTKLSFYIKLLKNKYIASVLVFVLWISFFDRNDLFTQWDRKQELNKLESSASFYEKEIAHTKKDLTDLNGNPAIIEKFAREKFFLKKPDEEIFLVSDSVDKKK